jgi:hypothetical protein
MRVPAKQALDIISTHQKHRVCVLHGNVVSIELLLVIESLEVGLDGKRNDTGWAVGQVLLECFRVYASSHVGGV